ncbi:SH3 domain-containing protein [Fulvivirga sediminis]|uniref:SH3 domain-containing protein n=1 Tax=Fulvivirga sediminis TaxID=2803949 RepID=A0A937FED9_9BACT|nr:SH3 domain-containing protein [Fulvivirga sediminis]MBL3658993.1 SH3 domain-containing protein [Fulvivirga sediminis]
MNFFYPEKDGNGEDLKFSNQFGKYLISHFNTWHGGVHIEGADKPLQAIADGRIIAYRMNREYQTLKDSSDNTNRKPREEKKYSNNFILIQHDIEISKEEVENEGADDEKTTVKKKFFTFYSLYNHLLPTSAYYKENKEEIRSGIDVPKFMRYETLKATQEQDYDFPATTIKGLNARTLNSAGVTEFRGSRTIKLVIPYGDKVCKVLDEEGKLIKNGSGIKVTYTDGNGDYHDDIYIYDRSPLEDLGDSYKINTDKDTGKFIDYLGFSDEKRIERGSRLREEANGDSAVIGLIPKGTIVNVLEKTEVKIKEGKETYWAKVEGYEGYTHSSNFEVQQEIEEVDITLDKIVACDIPIKAGEHIGYTGLLQGDLGCNYHAAQVDVFMTEEVDEFLSNAFEAGKDKKNYTILPQDTILKKTLTTNVDLPKGTTVKVLGIKDGYVNIQEDKQPVRASLNKSYLHNMVDPPGPRNAYFQIKPEFFDEINKSHFNNQIPDVNSFVYWLEQNGDITKVEYRPKNNPAEFWVKTKDLFPVEGTKTRDKKVTVPIPFGQTTDSFLEYLTKADCRVEEKIVQEEYFDIHPAKKGEHTTLNKNITTAYLAIPDNKDETGEDEELCKEAIVDLSKAKIIKENENKEWIQVTCSYVIGNKKETKKGWIENKNFDTFSLHNWKNSGFKTIRAGAEYMYEVKGLRDCNDSHASDFIKKFWKTLNVKNDDVLDIFELDAAYSMLETQLAVSKIVCEHKSEWSYTANDIADEVTKFYDYQISQEDESLKEELKKLKEDKLNTIKDQVGKLMFWKEASGLIYDPPKQYTLPNSNPEPIYDAHLGPTDEEQKARRAARVAAIFGTDDPEVQMAAAGRSPEPIDATTQTNNTDTETLTQPGVSEEKEACETQEQPQEEKQQEVKPPERTFPSTDQVWHFHPIAFVEHMKRIYGSGGSCESLIWGNKVSCQFRAKVIQIAKNLWGEERKIEMANNLMAVFAWESGETFKANAPNMANSGGTGLIQFMPSTIAGLLGRSKEELTIETVTNYWGNNLTLKRVKEFSDMSELRQLDYVEKYFKPLKGKHVEFVDFYLQVLFPASMGKPDNHVVFSKNGTGLLKNDVFYQNRINAYKQNKGFDTNKKYGNDDGIVTKLEIKKGIQKYLDEGEKHKNNCTDGSCTRQNDREENISLASEIIFHGYQNSDSKGCLRRCEDMLRSFGNYKVAPTTDSRVVQMTQYEGEDTENLVVQDNASEGLNLINNHIHNRIPIIVGIDWKKGNTGNNDNTTDHWVIIVGKETSNDGILSYHYFDPQTGHESIGTSNKNKLKLQSDGTLKDTYRGRKYVVTMVRPTLKN